MSDLAHQMNSTMPNYIANVTDLIVDDNLSTYYVIPKHTMHLITIVLSACLVPILSIAGIIGSVVSLIVLTRKKNKKTTTTILLIALATVDIFTLTVTLINNPTIACQIHFHSVGYTLKYALMIPYQVYLAFLPFVVGYWLILIVTFERVLSVAVPLKIRSICTKRVILVCVFCVIILTSILYIPNIFIFEVNKDENNTYHVSLGWLGKRRSTMKAFLLVRSIIGTITPVLGVCVSNIIISALHCINAKWRQASTTVVKGNSKERSVTKTVLTISVVFMVCLIPSMITSLMILFDESSEYYQYSSNVFYLMRYINVLLEVINCSSHFVIYIVTNPMYRRDFKDIFMCCCCRTRTTNDLPHTPSGKTNPTLKGKDLSTMCKIYTTQVSLNPFFLYYKSVLTLLIRHAACVCMSRCLIYQLF